MRWGLAVRGCQRRPARPPDKPGAVTAFHRGGQPTKPTSRSSQRTSHDAPDAAVAGCPLGQRHAPAIESADDPFHPRTAVAPRFRYGDRALVRRPIPVRRDAARLDRRRCARGLRGCSEAKAIAARCALSALTGTAGRRVERLVECHSRSAGSGSRSWLCSRASLSRSRRRRLPGAGAVASVAVPAAAGRGAGDWTGARCVRPCSVSRTISDRGVWRVGRCCYGRPVIGRGARKARASDPGAGS